MQYPTVELERKFWSEGKKYILGIDEAGRGPWAGPLSVGGFLLCSDTEMIDEVTDSKKLTRKKRELLFDKIYSAGAISSVIMIESCDIDRFGLSSAMDVAINRIVKDVEAQIKSEVDLLLIDGASIRTTTRRKCLKINRGDMQHYSIAAASIIAKVSRDRLMREYAKIYPEYGFESHSGYGTKKHSDAILRFGPCKIHRRSFKPIRKIIEESGSEQKADWKYW